MYKTPTAYLALLAMMCTMSEAITDSCSVSCAKCLLNTTCVPLRDDYVNVPGIGAYKLHSIPANWNTARSTCKQEGGYLAVPNSVAEAKAIGEVYANGTVTKPENNAFVYIGFHDQFKEGEYLTIFGQTLEKAGYDGFADGQPDNAGGTENCGSITRDGALNDINCGEKLGYVCELALCNSCYSF